MAADGPYMREYRGRNEEYQEANRRGNRYRARAQRELAHRYPKEYKQLCEQYKQEELDKAARQAKEEADD